MNEYERKARQRKAERLAAVFFDHARHAVFWMDTKGGKKPRSTKDAAASVIIMANEARLDVWRQVADAHGIRTPSVQCVDQAKALVRKRCEALIRGPKDPFQGLPKFN